MSLAPRLHEGIYAFVSVPGDTAVDLDGLDVVATVREDEGLTVVLPLEQAEARGHEVRLRAAWITLTAATDLTDVGVTARFARALADAKIPCNVIAGAHHDHVFVPVGLASPAMDLLSHVSLR